jgi:hypothetical protein
VASTSPHRTRLPNGDLTEAGFLFPNRNPSNPNQDLD